MILEVSGMWWVTYYGKERFGLSRIDAAVQERGFAHIEAHVSRSGVKDGQAATKRTHTTG